MSQWVRKMTGSDLPPALTKLVGGVIQGLILLALTAGVGFAFDVRERLAVVETSLEYIKLQLPPLSKDPDHARTHHTDASHTSRPQRLRAVEGSQTNP